MTAHLSADSIPDLVLVFFDGQHRSLMRITNEILTSGARLLLAPNNRATAREHGFTFEPDQYLADPRPRLPHQGHTVDLVQLAITAKPRVRP